MLELTGTNNGGKNAKVYKDGAVAMTIMVHGTYDVVIVSKVDSPNN